MKNRSVFVGLLAALIVFALIASGAAPSSAARGLQQAPTQTPELPSATLTPGVQTQAQNNFQAGVLAQFQQQLTGLYRQVEPSVVSITIYGQPSASSSLNGFPGGQQGQSQGQSDIVPLGAGSGFVWDNQGHIVTNNHVVENADQVEVTFANGSTFTATVVGTDPDSDLAVVKIDETPDFQLQPVRLSRLENVEVGQLAIALGNPFGLQGTMTVGIVSAIGRTLPVGAGTTSYIIPSIIQTDAPINPGNSGGVLVNIQGEVIGVPSAISSTSGVGSGVGFAIPADIVGRVVPGLIENGKFAHPYLGISGTALTPAIAKQMNLNNETRGALVIEVAPNGPAADAGLQGGSNEVTINGRQLPIGGDVITQINGQAVQSMDDLINFLTLNANAGDKVTLTVLRNGESRQVQVTLGTRPQTAQVPSTGSQMPGLPGLPNQNGQGGQNGLPDSSSPVKLGVMVAPLTPELIQQLDLPDNTNGVYVNNVLTNSPASQAGMASGDIITTYNGESVSAPEDLVQALQNERPGSQAQLTVLRRGKLVKLTVTYDSAAAPESGQGQGTRVPTATPRP